MPIGNLVPPSGFAQRKFGHSLWSPMIPRDSALPLENKSGQRNHDITDLRTLAGRKPWSYGAFLRSVKNEKFHFLMSPVGYIEVSAIQQPSRRQSLEKEQGHFVLYVHIRRRLVSMCAKYPVGAGKLPNEQLTTPVCASQGQLFPPRATDAAAALPQQVETGRGLLTVIPFNI